MVEDMATRPVTRLPDITRYPDGMELLYVVVAVLAIIALLLFIIGKR